METNDYFSTIRDFYKNKAFCDLKVIVVPMDDKLKENHLPILCHSLILSSAIPELRQCLLTIPQNEDDFLTIFVENSNAVQIGYVISGIYDALVSNDFSLDKDETILSSRIKWAKAFGLLPNTEPNEGNAHPSETKANTNSLGHTVVEDVKGAQLLRMDEV